MSTGSLLFRRGPAPRAFAPARRSWRTRELSSISRRGRRGHTRASKPRGARPSPRRATVTRAAEDGASNGLGLLTFLGPVVPQRLALVTPVKAAWKAAWQTMVTALAPQTATASTAGRRSRSTGQLEADANADFAAVGGDPRPCSWRKRRSVVPPRDAHDRAARAARPRAGRADDGRRRAREPWRLGLRVRRARSRVRLPRDLRDGCRPPSSGAYGGRCTAPLLVDRKNRRAVSSESADIVPC